MKGPFSILVIEDDAAVGRSLGEGLQRGGFHITWKASGEKVELDPSRPALILTVHGVGYRLVNR